MLTPVFFFLFKACADILLVQAMILAVVPDVYRYPAMT